MDLLREFSLLLERDLGDLSNKSPAYRRRSAQIATLLQQITDQVGEDLMGQYWALDGDRYCDDAMTCFLYGLRLGIELLRL